MYKKIFALFLVFILSLYIYFFTSYFGHPSEGIRDFKNYSIGDCIINEKLNNRFNRLFYRLYFNNSIADQYFRKTNKIEDYDALFEIVKKNRSKIELPPNDSLIIHLRIGDVIDWEYSGPIDDALEGRDGDFGYIKTYDYFEEKSKLLEKYNIKKIIIVGGYHTKEDHSRSEEYVRKVVNFLEKLGYDITLRIDEMSPDEDFLFMSNSKYFLKSGGNYSTILNKMVEMNNGITLEKNKII